MDLQTIFSAIIMLLTPILLYIIPLIGSRISYNYWIPIFIWYWIVFSIIISLLIFSFHLVKTKSTCDKQNTPDAILSALKVFAYMMISQFTLQYFPSILAPFSGVFGASGPIAKLIYRSTILNAIIFLLITYIGFSSVKKTCKPSIDQLKVAYTDLETKL